MKLTKRIYSGPAKTSHLASFTGLGLRGVGWVWGFWLSPFIVVKEVQELSLNLPGMYVFPDARLPRTCPQIFNHKCCCHHLSYTLES